MKRLFMFAASVLPGVILCLLTRRTGVPFIGLVLLVEAVVITVRRAIQRQRRDAGNFENLQLLVSTVGYFTGTHLHGRVNPPTAEYDAPVIGVAIWLLYVVWWLLLVQIIKGVLERKG